MRHGEYLDFAFIDSIYMEIEFPLAGEIKTTLGTRKFVPLAERCFWLASQSFATCSDVMAFVSATASR